MTAQLALLMRDQDRAELGSVRLRRACREVADEIGIKVLGDEWGCGHATVSNKLDEEERRALKPAELVDLMLRDRHARILNELCDLLGFEAPERKRILGADEKLQRLDDALTKMFPPEVVEVIRKKAGW